MEFSYLIGIALWALIPGFIAKKKGRYFWRYYFLSFLISPLLSAIITLCVKDLNAEDCYEQSTDTTKGTIPSVNYVPSNTPNWQCSCGRLHPKHESSCLCGKSKSDILLSVSAETALPESHTSSNQVRFCRKCGNKLIENSKFCSKCGTEVIINEKEGIYEVYKMQS